MELFQGLATRKISKGAHLQLAGDTSQFAYRTLSGCLKGYILDESGKEHIIQFAPEEWIISDINSLLHQVPARMNISALENTTVQLIPKDSLFVMDQLNGETLRQLNALYLNNMVATSKRLMHMLASSAEERYQEFLTQYPGLSQRIPQKLIAAYIGITPEYLSEVRRKLKDQAARGNS